MSINEGEINTTNYVYLKKQVVKMTLNADEVAFLRMQSL